MHKKMMRLAVALACLGLLSVADGAGQSKPVDAAAFKEPIRLACIGDSITAGVRAGGSPFPALIGKALGDRWEVTNLGVSGATMLKGIGASYDAKPQYAKALELKPDVVTIALGTNDSKPDIWKNKGTFEGDYKDMIAALRNANPKVIVYCCLPPPAFPGKWGINEATIKGEVIPLILKVAEETQCYVIDLYESLEGKAEHVPDTVHPNAEGHKLMAAAIYKALTGEDMPPEPPEAAPETAQ